MSSGAAEAGPVTVAPDALEDLVADSFGALGIPAADARAVASVLVYADLRGIESHGIHRMPAYLRRVRAGLAGGTDRMVEVGGSGVARRLDAGDALGPAAATSATDLAADLATRHGVGLVALGRATHFGAAGYYATRAARRGLVGIVLSNGPSGVVPHGATLPFLGTNPLAIGIPAGRYGEFVLDMSTAAIARERIRLAAADGATHPPGIAIDRAGRPTTAPLAALAGGVLPVGGAKGSGLGMAIMLLVVLLAGAEIDADVGSMYQDFDRPQNLGQLIVVLDPDRIGASAGGRRRVEDAIGRLHGLPRAVGHEPVRFSGERAAACERARRSAGVPVDRGTLDRIAEACRGAGLTGHEQRWRALGRTRERS